MTTPTSGSVPLPLFYRDPVLLRAADHAGFGLIRTNDMGFARATVAIPLLGGEFAHAGRHYPIVFANDDSAMPLAVTGVSAGNNLFIGEDGRWRAQTYIPGYIRRYPFIAMAVEEGGPTMLAVDLACERVVSDTAARKEAEPFFTEAGQPTAISRAAMELCDAYSQDFERTRLFVQALKEQKLLVEKSVQIRYHDPLAENGVASNAPHAQVDGFRLIDEQAFRALPKEVVADFHARGWLDLAVLHLASQLCWQNLVEASAPARREI